jgi:hypothetical protein
LRRPNRWRPLSLVGGELRLVEAEEDQLVAVGQQHQRAVRKRLDVPQPFADPDRLAVDDAILPVETKAIQAQRLQRRDQQILIPSGIKSGGLDQVRD